METPNVNNLNGVPNFGHGFPEELTPEVATEVTVEEPSEETKDGEAQVELSETNE